MSSDIPDLEVRLAEYRVIRRKAREPKPERPKLVGFAAWLHVNFKEVLAKKTQVLVICRVDDVIFPAGCWGLREKYYLLEDGTLQSDVMRVVRETFPDEHFDVREREWTDVSVAVCMRTT